MLSLRSVCIGAISTSKSLYHIDESIMVLSAGSQMKACRLNSPRVLLPTVIGFGLDSLYAGARACGTCRPQIGLRNVLQQASREVSQGSTSYKKKLDEYLNQLEDDDKHGRAPAQSPQVGLSPCCRGRLQTWANVCLAHDFKALPMRLCVQSKQAQDVCRKSESTASCVLSLELPER